MESVVGINFWPTHKESVSLNVLYVCVNNMALICFVKFFKIYIMRIYLKTRRAITYVGVFLMVLVFPFFKI